MIVVGNKTNHELSVQSLNKLSINNYQEIVEAVPRNTAAAITFSALFAQPEDILLVTPSDHIIKNQLAYETAVQNAVRLAGEGFLVTFGIPPTRPETGYGYIRHSGNDVEYFVEKPPLEKAEEMLRAGNFLWNSGMFCFKATVFLEELKKYAPEVLEKTQIAAHRQKDGILPETESKAIPSISIDYAVMEHSDKIKVVIPAKDLGWSDLGTFDSLWSYRETDTDSSNNSNNLVINAKKPVFFIGEQPMIFVETEDAILILPRGKGQNVKELYEQLEKERPELVN